MNIYCSDLVFIYKISICGKMLSKKWFINPLPPKKKLINYSHFLCLYDILFTFFVYVSLKQYKYQMYRCWYYIIKDIYFCIIILVYWPQKADKRWWFYVSSCTCQSNNYVFPQLKLATTIYIYQLYPRA